MIYQPFLGELRGVQITRECYYRAMEQIIIVFEEEHGINLPRDLVELHLVAMEYAEKKGINPYEFAKDATKVIYTIENPEDYRLIHEDSEYPYHGFNQSFRVGMKQLDDDYEL